MVNPETVKRRLRSTNFCRPLHPTLGIRLIDGAGINLHLAMLRAMGVSIQEFKQFLPPLLLMQLSDLNTALQSERNKDRKEEIENLIFETKQELWPLKN